MIDIAGGNLCVNRVPQLTLLFITILSFSFNYSNANLFVLHHNYHPVKPMFLQWLT